MQELTLIYGDRGSGKTTYLASIAYQLVREYQSISGMSYDDACKSVPILHNIEGLKIGLSFKEFIGLHPHLGFRDVRSFFQPIYEDKESPYKVLLGYTFLVDEASHLYLRQKDIDAETKQYLDRMRHYGHVAYFASVTLDYPKGFCETCQNYVQAVTDAHNPFPFCHMYIRRTGATVRHRDSYAGFFLRRKSKKIQALFQSSVCKPTFKQVAYRPAMYLAIFATLVLGYFFYNLYHFFTSRLLPTDSPSQAAAAPALAASPSSGPASSPFAPPPAHSQPPPEPEFVPCLPGYPKSRFSRDKGRVPLRVSYFSQGKSVFIYYEDRWQNLSRLSQPYVITREGIYLMLLPAEYCFTLNQKGSRL
jgi:energy-coupling factor transporter ATP-binding protein EcfA2